MSGGIQGSEQYTKGEQTMDNAQENIATLIRLVAIYRDGGDWDEHDTHHLIEVLENHLTEQGYPVVGDGASS